MILKNVCLDTSLIFKISLSLFIGWFLYVFTGILYPELLFTVGNNSFPNMLFVYVVVLVPIVEELFFRYLILKILMRYASLITAVMTSVFCFAWFHINQPVFITSIIAGFFLIFLFLALGNIIYPVIAHSLYNFLVWFSVFPVITEYLIFILIITLAGALIILQGDVSISERNGYHWQ